MSIFFVILTLGAIFFPRSFGGWIAEIVDAYEKARAEMKKGKPE